MDKQHLIAAISPALSLFASFLYCSTASAAPELPPQAKPHVAPFRVIHIEHEGLSAWAKALYTTVDDPINHETGAFPGIAKLILERTDLTVGCTGTLLSTKEHLLTAAHCVTDEFGSDMFASGTATFATGEQIEIESVHLHPDWDGDFLRGNDIAILQLVAPVSDSLPGYDIDRNSNDDVGSINEKIGYGLSGYGNEGYDSSLYGFGTKRNGQNKYDAVADTLLKALGLRAGKDFVRGAVLQYDFDNGLAENDAFGLFFNISDLGLGNDEVSSAPGDSGGPTIKGGVIQGVTSYGITLQLANGDTADVTPGEIDSSFGEILADTRVSMYAAWIDSILGLSSDSGLTSCSPGQQRKGKC